MINILGVDLILKYRYDYVEINIGTTTIGSVPTLELSHRDLSNDEFVEKYRPELESIVKDKATVIKGLLQKQREKVTKKIDKQLEAIERVV